MQFPTSICQLIAEYSAIYKLNSRIRCIDNLSRRYLSVNPNAFDMYQADNRKHPWDSIESNTSKEFLDLIDEKYDIDSCLLSANKSRYAIDILKSRPDLIDWYSLSANPAAIELLEANLNLISWHQLSANSAAMELLQANPDKIDWNGLSYNENPDAIKMLKANPSKINWTHLSANPGAIELLEANLDRIHWPYLSKNPNAHNLIKNNLHKVNFESLTLNPICIDYLDEINNKVRGYHLACVLQHPKIFKPEIVEQHLTALLNLKY